MMMALPLLAATIPATPDCRAMRVAKPAGAVVVMADSVEVSCPIDTIAAKLRYDGKNGVAVARVDLAEGDVLGRVYLPPRPDVLPGDKVQIVARIGHVELRRDVTAIQAAGARQRYFARDAAGHVLRAPQLVGKALP